ncbi:MraZ protein [Mycoplasmopsis mustelae]|uniref:Transcriptional regulator MraZ n=1 Tax=Mycoplasmopsis mustelae TaxID=171289 RepID=A0A4R7UEQ8_9BACT|nr:cell division/cell wall cluster transcriptional repressor MraZ [Mycoplasmopsis mustelae]TDV24114.1 MraZ protein [Mycoplasmopsis mustelae]
MYGQYTRNLDDKNRVILPSVFQGTLGSTFMVSIGFDGNAELRSITDFEKYKNIIESKSSFNPEVRMLARFILGNSFQASLDSVGRFSIPKNITLDLAIKKEITFVGVGSVVELWAKEKLDTLNNQYSLSDMAKLAERISEK